MVNWPKETIHIRKNESMKTNNEKKRRKNEKRKKAQNKAEIKWQVEVHRAKQNIPKRRIAKKSDEARQPHNLYTRDETSKQTRDDNVTENHRKRRSKPV